MDLKPELAEIVRGYPRPARDVLQPLLQDPDVAGNVPAAQMDALASALGLHPQQVITALLPLAAAYSINPISGYAVGAVALGSSTGTAYLGANIEFAGTSMSFAVHAEQSAVANAWSHDEHGISVLATDAAPCGFCRQFLWELPAAEALVILTPSQPPRPLAALLPAAFGPGDLGVATRLMLPQHHPLELVHPDRDPLVVAALDAARQSYAPYSGGYAGASLLTANGTIVQGRYAENAAFNPGLGPLQAAVAGWRLRGGSPASINRAVLVQQPSLVDLEAVSREILATCSTAALEVHLARAGL